MISLSLFCRLLGVTPQAYYQHFWQVEFKTTENSLVIGEVLRISENHKHMGARKLFQILQPFLLDHKIKMGRDAFFDLLQANNLLSDVKNEKYILHNLFIGIESILIRSKVITPSRPNQIWVSDITYWKINCGYVYISLITDAYSRKIVGYNVADTLEAIETTQALKNALNHVEKSNKGLIHHSDRGIQYCCTEYVRLLKENHIEISITQNGDPYENAQAERSMVS